MIEKTYLPFTKEELYPHFTHDAKGHLKYFQDSADRYRRFLETNRDKKGIPITESRSPRQIEKDERFWTTAAM